jgi:hypothetical protein
MNAKIGRNDSCHCGSGKKYKKCHLEKDESSQRKEREKAALNAEKVAAAAIKEEQASGNQTKSAPKVPTHGEKPNWMQKVAGKMGFFKPPQQHRGTQSNKGG